MNDSPVPVERGLADSGLEPLSSGAPGLSVIIVNYNTRERLLSALDRLHARGDRDLETEIIVVDNASSDGSVAAARSHASAPRVIERSVNGGFAVGVNEGIRAARGRILVLVNSDALVDPGALGVLAGYLDEHPRTGAAGGRVRNHDGSLQPTAFREPSVLDSWLEFGFLPGGIHPAPDATGPVDWVSGAFLAVRRAVVDEVGGLDERFFLYSEDVDWCRRIRSAGHEVHYVAEAGAVHEGRGSDSEGGNFSLRAVASRIDFHRKHQGGGAARLLRAALAVNWLVILIAVLPLSLLPGRFGRRARRVVPKLLKLLSNAGNSRPAEARAILVAIVDFPNGVGGDTRRVHMLARSLLAGGIRTTLLIPCSRGLVKDGHSDVRRETIDGIEVIRVSRGGSYGHDPSLGLSGTLRLFALRWTSLFGSLAALIALRRRGAATIYLYQPTFYDGFFYWLLGRLLGFTLVADYCDLSFVDHDRIERNPARRLWALNYRWGMTWLPPRLDRVFVISRFLMERMSARVRPGRLKLVPPVVDASHFDVTPPPGLLASHYGVQEGCVILYAGSFFENEGVETLIRAVPAVLARIPGARFLIIGGHPADAKVALMKLASELRVEAVVTFTGTLPSLDMPVLFRAADILVAPKIDSILNRAGVPTKLVEYLASGRPVVTTAVGDIPLLVRDQVEALLATPGSPAELAGAIVCLAGDQARARAIGEAGRARVLRDYDVKAIGSLIRTELDSIRTRSRPS